MEHQQSTADAALLKTAEQMPPGGHSATDILPIHSGKLLQILLLKDNIVVKISSASPVRAREDE